MITHGGAKTLYAIRALLLRFIKYHGVIIFYGVGMYDINMPRSKPLLPF